MKEGEHCVNSVIANLSFCTSQTSRNLVIMTVLLQKLHFLAKLCKNWHGSSDEILRVSLWKLGSCQYFFKSLLDQILKYFGQIYINSMK